MKEDHLDTLRTQIDVLDEELITLLARRFRLTDKIGEIKKVQKLPAVDDSREALQFARISELAQKNRVSVELARSVLRLIIDQVVEDHKLKLG